MLYVTLDFETFYDKGYTLEALTYEQYIRDERFKIHCVGISIDGQPAIVYRGDEILPALENVFSDSEETVLICHNTLFDGAILNWVFDLKADHYYCTQAMSRALWNQRPASLDQLAKSCFPDDETKRKGKEIKEFKGKRDLTPDEQQILENYCANDVNLTFECFRWMYRYFPPEELEVLDLTLKMFVEPVLVLDRQRVEEHLAKVKEETTRLVKASGVAHDVLSSNDKFAAWILEQGIPFEKIPSPTEKDPNNMKWPLAKDAIEFLALQRNYPQYKHVWDARKAVKSTIDRTRAERMLDHARVSHINPYGRIAMPLNYAAAHTLRWGGTNSMNPQNFKRGSELRKALKAPDGYAVLVHDLAGIEHRKNAWWSNEDWMLTAFKQNRDLYMEFATKIYKRPITDKKAQFLERFVGKVCELQLMYGAGWKGLQTSLAKGALGGPPVHLSDREADETVRLYRDTHPNIQKNWRTLETMLGHMCHREARVEHQGLIFEYQRVRMPNGLCMTYPGLRATPKEDRPGYDFTYWNGQFYENIYGGKFTENIVSCLSRITITEHMLLAARYLATIGGRVVLTVHDELVSIAPLRFAEEASEKIAGFMRTPPKWCNDGRLTLEVEYEWDVFYSK